MGLGLKEPQLTLWRLRGTRVRDHASRLGVVLGRLSFGCRVLRV